MTALTVDELMAWVEVTTQRWRELIGAHPAVLALPCDILDTGTVAHLIQHITIVELRYAQRLAGLRETSYDEVSTETVETLYAPHEKAMALLREVLAREDYAWEEPMVFNTRSLGELKASRRAILVHLLMHAIRHYAQLATLVRQHGIKPGWGMDYLMMAATRG